MNVAEQAIDRLRELIVTGELSPGERLPPEPQLSAALGISRPTLREAVRALTQARVLDVRRGDGTFVTSLEPSLLLSGMVFAMDLLRGHQLLEVFEVRRLLEPAATALAAGRRSSDDIAALRECAATLRAEDDPESAMALDLAFHARVASTAGNQTLASILGALNTRALRARMWRWGSDGGDITWALHHHDLIVQAVADGDAELARSAAAVHLAESETWLREVLARDVGPTT